MKQQLDRDRFIEILMKGIERASFKIDPYLKTKNFKAATEAFITEINLWMIGFYIPMVFLLPEE